MAPLKIHFGKITGLHCYTLTLNEAMLVFHSWTSQCQTQGDRWPAASRRRGQDGDAHHPESRGTANSSASKVPALQRWEPEFNPQNPHLKEQNWVWSCMLLIQACGTRRSADPWSLLTDQSCLLAQLEASEKECWEFKLKRGRWGGAGSGRTPKVVFWFTRAGTYLCTLTHTRNCDQPRATGVHGTEACLKGQGGASPQATDPRARPGVGTLSSRQRLQCHFLVSATTPTPPPPPAHTLRRDYLSPFCLHLCWG